MKVDIGGSGIVKTFSLEAGTNNPDFVSCLHRTLRRWVFPSTGSDIRIEFPILFKGS